MTGTIAAIVKAAHILADGNYGYSQPARWSGYPDGKLCEPGDFDCGTATATVLLIAGYPLDTNGIFSGNFSDKVRASAGFTAGPNPKGKSLTWLKEHVVAGAILSGPGHVVLGVGNGKILSWEHSEKGTDDGKIGRQKGEKVGIRDLYVREKGWAKLDLPPVEVAVPTVTAFDVTTYNCEDPRFGGHTSDDASVLTKASASVYLLTECPESVRNAIRARMNGGARRWLVWTRADNLPQAIMFDSTKYAHKTSKAVTFGPTSYHGAVIAVLTRLDTNRQVQFATLHLPASKQANNTQRKAFFNKLIKALDKKLPVVLGGDFNTPAAAAWLKTAGFSVSVTGATTDHGARYDFIACRGGVVSNAVTFNPGPASDHLAVKAHITIGG